MRQVGVIGLGLVGRALTQRLLHAGHVVCGFDIAEGARRAAQGIGVQVLPDAKEAARASSIVVLSLMTSADRRSLLWGEQSLAEALAPGTVILDTTTGAPEDLLQDHARLAAQKVRLVDVCLSGSSLVVEEGRALALVGDRGENADYSEVVSAISKAQYYFGAPGQGCRAKLIVNLVFGLNRLVLAEALGLARHAGFDPAALLEVLKAGETYSVAMDTKGPKMISGEYEPAVARLAQHAKDVRLILDLARETGAFVPLSELHHELIEALVREGHGALDNAAIFKAFER